MQRTLPFSPWQQARRTVRARRRCSVGQVLKSARTSTLPAGHRIGGVTCVMTGPAPSRANIAAGSHHRAPRGTLTRIPRFRPEPRVAATLRCVSTNRTGRVKVQCVCRGGLRPVATSGRGTKPASGTHFARKVPRRSSAACICYTSPVRFTGSAEHAGARRRCASARSLKGLSAPARPPAPAGSGTPGKARWPACAPSCGT